MAFGLKITCDRQPRFYLIETPTIMAFMLRQFECLLYAMEYVYLALRGTTRVSKIIGRYESHLHKIGSGGPAVRCAN